ncbi:MAG: ABC transporter ATP-binding protein [Lachnospiraceae bacterium]|nr:ABC transporter ATP-binding protein [Lachnospiraceae bacterium]
MNNKKLFINIVRLTKMNLKLQLSGFIIIIIYSIIILLSPAASGYLIDKTFAANNISDMLSGISIFCIAIILQPIIGFLKDIIYTNIVLNLNLHNSLLLFKKIIYAPLNFFDNTKKGEIISKIINDTSEISSFVSSFFSILLKNLILTILIIFCMFYISIKITIIILFLLLILFIINKKLNDKIEGLSLEVAENKDLIYSNVEQAISCIVTIKCFCNENMIINNYKFLLKKSLKKIKRKQILATIIKNFSTLIVMISLSLIYFIGCIDVLYGNLSVGNVISLGLYYQLIMNPLFEIVNCIIDMNSIKPIFKRFNDLEQMKDESQENYYDEINKLNCTNDIHIQHVNFKYRNKIVLENICLDIPEKGYIGIIGKSGTGKSTLIKLLTGFYEPSSGKISIGHINIKELGCNNLRKKIALVPQDIKLFNSSIIDNFIYANKNLTYEEIIDLCKKVNMHEKIMSTDKKYETIINEIANISGGEKQRIGIAMALAKEASIIILDEPTSALDFFNEKLIVKLLKEVSKEKLIIIISHKKNTLNCADKIFSLENSKISEVIK